MGRCWPYFVRRGHGVLRWYTLALLVFIPLIAGCVMDEDRQEEIKQKVRAGEYDEAERLAYKYFADDKGVRLVTLEYIAHQKDKASKEAYRVNVSIDEVRWSTDPSGVTTVLGRCVNRGDRTITGLGIRVGLTREGRLVQAVRASSLLEVGPGSSGPFQCRIEAVADFDDISIEIVDLGLKD